MSAEFDDDMAREVAANEFAGGASVAHLAAEWERDADWVEESIRLELLKYIPRRDGGLKLSRADLRKASARVEAGVDALQQKIEW